MIAIDLFVNLCTHCTAPFPFVSVLHGAIPIFLLSLVFYLSKVKIIHYEPKIMLGKIEKIWKNLKWLNTKQSKFLSISGNCKKM